MSQINLHELTLHNEHHNSLGRQEWTVAPSSLYREK